ncbi:hypothetical protein FOZ63_026628 [Perkinsus olseni]|uniref:Uncharacterized protein n=1 Tax=Perkinsus olseni TaxID=32597 RepID=A0A7J6RZU6_PEROL|nr:hypothetical protein FOZ63_026628 [Perkinsus olseni]
MSIPRDHYERLREYTALLELKQIELTAEQERLEKHHSEELRVERYKLPAVAECPITIRELKESLHHVILVELAKYERSIVNKWIEEERRWNLEQGLVLQCLLAMPKEIEAVISSNKTKSFKLGRLCGMFKAKRDETSTENLLKRLAYTKQRIQELQEWEVAFLAEWNLEVMLSDFCGRGAAYRQILKKPYGLQKRNMMTCGESKRSQWPRASVMSPVTGLLLHIAGRTDIAYCSLIRNQRQRRSPGRWTRHWNDNLISDFEARRGRSFFYQLPIR